MIYDLAQFLLPYVYPSLSFTEAERHRYLFCLLLKAVQLEGSPSRYRLLSEGSEAQAQ